MWNDYYNQKLKKYDTFFKNCQLSSRDYYYNHNNRCGSKTQQKYLINILRNHGNNIKRVATLPRS